MQKFTTPAPITTVLDIPAGRIRFTGSERAETTVSVRPADPALRRDVKLAEQAEIDFRDGVLRIKASASKQYFGPSGTIEVVVELPAGSSVSAKAASTELHSTGRLGEVTVESAQGDITLEEASGLRLTTQSGDISVGRLTGPAGITTSKGDIRIAEAVSGTVELSTQAGSVSIGVAAGVSASLDAGTSHGRIRNALQNASGTPEVVIQATTAYGDIEARSL
jgi:DUF4097 and DUF4098 domain-containing protein YvlB